MRKLKDIFMGDWADVSPRDKVMGNIGQRTIAVWIYEREGEVSYNY